MPLVHTSESKVGCISTSTPVTSCQYRALFTISILMHVDVCLCGSDKCIRMPYMKFWNCMCSDARGSACMQRLGCWGKMRYWN
jgi:hypothetical protein